MLEDDLIKIKEKLDNGKSVSDIIKNDYPTEKAKTILKELENKYGQKIINDLIIRNFYSKITESYKKMDIREIKKTKRYLQYQLDLINKIEKEK